MGKEFLKIVSQCFPTSNSLHKIFNKNTIKLSYSCMPNLEVIIESDNKRKMQAEKKSKQDSERKCNCQKSSLPTQRRMPGKRYHLPSNPNFWDRNLCRTNSYNIQGTIHQPQGLLQFRLQAQYNKTPQTYLATKGNNSEYAIKWKILSHTPHYSNRTKRCQLCISEKYFIICKGNCASLNKRNELISK